MKKVLNVLFIASVVIALGLAAAYLFIQVASVVTVNGSLAMWADSNLEKPVCIMCSVSAIIAFVMSYVFNWKSGD